MESLHAKILDAARETCAHKRNVDGYETLKHHFTLNGLTETLSDFETEAALLAMDRLAEFYRWASVGYYFLHQIDNWVKKDTLPTTYTELELYNIWREPTTQQ